jgi:hypothetical protein
MGNATRPAAQPGPVTARAFRRTRRPSLPPTVVFGGVGLAFAGVAPAAGAPTPLLVVFEPGSVF